MIELLIAIGVISILTAVSLPGITTWRHNAHLKSAARDLYSNLQKAKLNAVKTNREYAIVFNTASNSYTLVNSGPDGDYDGPLGTEKDDNIDEQKVDLSSYGSGVKYGHGSVTTDVTGAAFPSGDITYTDNDLVFISQGMLQDVSSVGYVYLCNDENNLCYAIGTPTVSGVIIMKKGSGASWQ